VLPDGTVTVTPLLIVIGPALMALFSVGITIDFEIATALKIMPLATNNKSTFALSRL
jgi:hypothetical protein